MDNIKILVITPVSHIKGVLESLKRMGEVVYQPDPTEKEVIDLAHDCHVIFTNPNKSKVFLGERVLADANNLKVICTASTGTVHIDKQYLQTRSISLLSLTKEFDTINQISSTAEHAFALMMSAIRNVVSSHNNALKGEWNYESYIGRQINFLTIGVVGFGRLGKKFAHYSSAFGARVMVYDPYVSENEMVGFERIELIQELFNACDVVSLHCHVTEETTGMVNEAVLKAGKPNILLVNTARGEIVDEESLVKFLVNNPNAKYATDVVNNEQQDRLSSPLFNSDISNQLVITQHIGGMTTEAQEIAYGRAVELLSDYLRCEG